MPSCKVSIHRSILHSAQHAEAAQLFTEMNGRELKPLHQLFNRACFIPHREAAKDFADPDDSFSAERARHRRANLRTTDLPWNWHHNPGRSIDNLKRWNSPTDNSPEAVTASKFIRIARSRVLSGSVFDMPDKGVFRFRDLPSILEMDYDTDANGEYTDDEGWDLTHERATTGPVSTALPFECPHPLPNSARVQPPV